LAYLALPYVRQVLCDDPPKRIDRILLNDLGRRIDVRLDIVVRHRDE
jgi:hypothetical protein